MPSALFRLIQAYVKYRAVFACSQVLRFISGSYRYSGRVPAQASRTRVHSPHSIIQPSALMATCVELASRQADKNARNQMLHMQTAACKLCLLQPVSPREIHPSTVYTSIKQSPTYRKVVTASP